MAATTARRAAFDLALRIERDAAYAGGLLHAVPASRLGRRDHAFVTELVKGSLRRQGELDHLISRRLHKPLAALDLEVLTCLRLGAYQLRHMRGVADHAAVSESVELVKRARKRSAASLVNAVLRRLPPAPPEPQAARLSHPAWLVRRWESALGHGLCSKLLIANLRRPAAFFRIPAPDDPEVALERLRRLGVSAVPTDHPRAYRLTSKAAEAARLLTFQDLNSQRVGALVKAARGSVVLDVCAAPGGKARILAESATVVAADRHLHRLRLMRRLGDADILAVAIDAEARLPFNRRFDRVLVDAPCSGTGTLARNPEIKWRLRPADIADLSNRQTRILRNALHAVAPGGQLIYATCSLEPEENEHVVRTVIAESGGWDAERVLSTLPGRDPGDGFQAWRIRRLGD